MSDTGGRNISRDANGDVHVGKGLGLGTSTSVVAGTLRYDGGIVEKYSGASWEAITGGSATGALQIPYTIVYTMDEPSGNLINTAPFASTLNHDGVLLGGTPPVRVADSPVATSPNCLEFVAGSYVEIANPTAARYDSQPSLMLQFWYKGTAYAEVIRRDNNGVWGGGSSKFAVSANNLVISMWGGATQTFAGGALHDGNWHHIELCSTGISTNKMSCKIDGFFRGNGDFYGEHIAGFTSRLGCPSNPGVFRLADFRYTAW